MRLASQRAHATPILVAMIALVVWACGSSVSSPSTPPGSPSAAVTDDGQIVQSVTAGPTDTPSQSVISATPFSG